MTDSIVIPQTSCCAPRASTAWWLIPYRTAGGRSESAWPSAPAERKSSGWRLMIQLAPEAAKRLEDLTRSHMNRPIAVVVRYTPVRLRVGTDRGKILLPSEGGK